MTGIDHLAVFPIVLPLLIGILLMLPPLQNRINRQRVTALLGLALLVAASTTLLIQTLQEPQLYMLGNWQPPFGILLVADRVAALLVLLTSVLGLAANLFACAGDDEKGRFFHPLFMFQIMGINGAFLTGDIFNLFVFFEILLIASYALLMHGGGKHKIQASVHYVVLNLIGSAFFLFALGILYGTLGTLNMFDMMSKVRFLTPEDATLAKAGTLLLLSVFGLKAAALPLHFWLPKTYGSATAAVAALFAIMTKVGIYSIWRVHNVVFGEQAETLASVAIPWLWPMAFLTLVVGAIAALASQNLRTLAANLVIISVGTLLFSAALNTPEALAAGLYYLVHSTLISAALFMIAGLIQQQRGQAEDRFVSSRRMGQSTLLGITFALAAMAVIGMPPLSGFVGKALLLQASSTSAGWVWPALLIAGLISLVALSRAGTTLFWRNSKGEHASTPAHPFQVVAVLLLLSASPLLVLFGGPITEFNAAAAEEFFQGLTLAEVIQMAGATP